MRMDALQQARHLLAGGDVVAARKWLEEHAGDPPCRVLLREYLLGEGLTDAARSHITALAAGDDAEARVSRSIEAFLGGDLTGALRECQAALTLDENLATAWNHRGRALHNLGRAAEAGSALQRATELAPDYAEAWHNLGHVRRAGGDMQGAALAFRTALEHAPGYRSARHNLGITLFHLDDITGAAARFDELLAHDPDDVAALVDGGLTCQLLGDWERAMRQYQHALELDPDNPTAWCYLGMLHNERMDTPAALQALQNAVRLDPDDVEAWVELTGVHEQSNHLAAAREALQNGLRVAPGHPALLVEQARLDRREGHAEQAVACLRSLDLRGLPARLAQQAWFELGQALDRTGDADAAFSAFENGNRLAADSVRSRSVNRDAFGERCQRLEDWMAEGAPGARLEPGASGEAGEDLCFLVGFPRSGTTLIDTLLETSPAIAALEESATLEYAIARLQQRSGGYPRALADVGSNDLDALRNIYREAVSAGLGRDWPQMAVDKMPLRFMHAGLMHTLFPRARVLFVLRHPCDVVLSNFMQQFIPNEANVHLHTLTDCTRMYCRLMTLWQQAQVLFPLRLLEVRYEALVQDQEAALGQIGAFLDIEALDTKLDADARLATRQRVRTASYQQVAEPLYQRAAGRWRRYRKHLEPHLAALEPFIDRLGYAIDP